MIEPGEFRDVDGVRQVRCSLYLREQETWNDVEADGCPACDCVHRESMLPETEGAVFFVAVHWPADHERGTGGHPQRGPELRRVEQGFAGHVTTCRQVTEEQANAEIAKVKLSEPRQIAGLDLDLLGGFLQKTLGLIGGDRKLEAAGEGLLSSFLFRKSKELGEQARREQLQAKVAAHPNRHEVLASGSGGVAFRIYDRANFLSVDDAENLAVWLLVALGQSERGMDDAVAVAKALLENEDECAAGSEAPAESEKT